MGVDFVMEEVRPLPRRRFEEVEGDGTRFSQRLFILSLIFLEEYEGMTFGRTIRAGLARKIACRWFEDAYRGFVFGGRRPDLRDCWDSAEIHAEVREVQDFLRAHDGEFPRRFVLRDRPGGREAGDSRIVLGGHAYNVRGEWGRCVAYPMETDLGIPPSPREMEFSSGLRIRCRQIGFSRRPDGTFGDVLAGDITLYVESVPFFEHFRPDLEAMLILCGRAEKAAHRVFTYVA